MSTRPIGIPTFEDKVLQRAVSMLLDAVYEQDFLDCSYAFRRGRSAHQALDALWRGVMSMGGGWVLELDIESFFDTMSHSRLREFLDKRMCDGVMRRAIDKWFKAGVMEGEITSRPEAGVPQGGVVSPILSNLYLEKAARTVSYVVSVDVSEPGHFSYSEDSVLQMADRDDLLHHTDTNRLVRVES